MCQNCFFSADYGTSCSTDGKYIACASRKKGGKYAVIVQSQKQS
jgi:hypothetical protein